MSIFDEVIDRSNTQSYKWNVKENDLPMWVADMDFQTAPAIREAMQKRLDHGIFGYSLIPDAWYEAYTGWWSRRYQFDMKKEWLLFCNGVIPAISSVVRKLTCPAEKVVVMSPVYNMFYHSIYNNGRNILECPLDYENGAYSINFEALEKACADPQSTLLILCNPHNPAGILWDRETLARIGAICEQNHVTVLSDEIHCDLTIPGKSYIPFASVSDTCADISVTCIAPTKTFNIAGLQSAAVCVPNPTLRHKVRRALNTDEVAEGNAFSCDAAIAAYEHGEAWLDELRQYLADNRSFAEDYINGQIPGLYAVHGDATYLLWIDCSSIGISSDRLAVLIREKTGLFLSEGAVYRGNGAQFLRMNLACPRSRVEDGVKRLKQAVEQVQSV
jgi:cystathionine beta-lyase